MSLFIASINSGSNGNCYYAGNDNEAILVDAGIPCREIEKRMKRLGLNLQKVKAIFISHEHGDHIRGVEVLAKKYQLPVYITPAAHRQCNVKIEPHLVRTFAAGEPVLIGSLSVIAFPKFHDASDPYSFVVDCNEIKVGVFTDIGAPCSHLIKHFKQCHAAFLEANYDEQMLERGSYPYHLKKRIRGGLGHLSNRQALELFVAHKPAFMTHLFLAHLSKNNNCPDLVSKLFEKHAGSVKTLVASRYEESRVYHITGTGRKKPGSQAYVSSSKQLVFSFA